MPGCGTVQQPCLLQRLLTQCMEQDVGKPGIQETALASTASRRASRPDRAAWVETDRLSIMPNIRTCCSCDMFKLCSGKGLDGASQNVVMQSSALTC